MTGLGRAKDGDLHKTMALPIPEFIRRFLIHVLPSGFHRIRHYGLFANHIRVKRGQQLRELLTHITADAPAPSTNTVDAPPSTSTYTCKSCGAPMVIIETFFNQLPRAPPACS